MVAAVGPLSRAVGGISTRRIVNLHPSSGSDFTGAAELVGAVACGPDPAAVVVVVAMVEVDSDLVLGVLNRAMNCCSCSGCRSSNAKIISNPRTDEAGDPVLESNPALPVLVFCCCR